jgi:hypothetical protein
LGRNTETHNEQSTREPVPGAEIIVHILPSKKLNFIWFFLSLANINTMAGVKPTLALIETLANPKRCGFGLSIQKFGLPSLNQRPKSGWHSRVIRFS